MKKHLSKLLLLIGIMIIGAFSCTPEVEQYKWETIRGVNVDYDIEEEEN